MSVEDSKNIIARLFGYKSFDDPEIDNYKGQVDIKKVIIDKSVILYNKFHNIKTSKE